MEARTKEFDIGRIREQLRSCQAQGLTFAAIEQQTGISRSAISQLANHAVTMHASKLRQLSAWLAANAPESAGAEGAANPLEPMGGAALSNNGGHKTQIEIYPTKNLTRLIGWLDSVYRHKAIGALVGPSGSGKTTTLKEYAKVNAGARYVKCWALMHMGDLLELIGQAFDVPLRGSLFKRQQTLIAQLNGRDAMLMLDEAEFLKSWTIKKLEVLREIWDAIGIPIVLCGTDGLKDVLTRGTGRDNCAQLYRRCWQGTTGAMEAGEIEMILREYDITPDAVREIAQMATDHRHGGMGNAFEVLRIALELAEGRTVTHAMVREAMQYKVRFG